MHLLSKHLGFCSQQAVHAASLRRAPFTTSSLPSPVTFRQQYALLSGISFPRSSFSICAPRDRAWRFDARAGFDYSPAQQNEEDLAEVSKRKQVSERLQSTARYFRRLGSLGFWSQLVCTIVSAVILAFSVAISGTPASQATFYATAAGIIAAFLSAFWSFGYMRLSERLRNTVNDLKNAPPRADVVKNLRSGLIINLLGMGLTLLGMQATVGTLVAKALTSTANPYFQGRSPSYSPVLALDVFLVQASANTVLSHFLGLVFSLELLRSVTLSQPPPKNVIPKLA